MATKTMKRSRMARQQSSPYPSAASSVALPEPMHPTGTWTAEEHDRFLEAMKLFPKGPWKSIADHVVTRSVRQVQTHAQKYQEKVVRRMRGLRKPKRKGEESEEDIGHRVVMGTFGKLRKRKSEEGELASSVSSPMDSHTDKESVDSDSNDGSDVESTEGEEPDHTATTPTSSSTSSHADDHTKTTKSFTSFLVEQSPVGAECIELAPLPLNDLRPGWLYLDDLNDKTLDLFEEVCTVEGPTGLPSLGESLDFFIEHLSIVI